MDTVILKKWLSAGYIDQGTFYTMDNGTPQGGIISPALLNATLSGLESAVKAVVSIRDKINISIYADDFIITGATQMVLEQKVKPAVENFLKIRGLELSAEKSKITTLREGFDFLGFNVRKYGDKLFIKPARKSVQRFLENIRELIRKNRATSTAELIAQLNPRISGWANYYRHGVAKSTYSYIDEQIFIAIWRWIKRKHPEKNTQWLRKKYFRSQGLRNWIFYAKIPTADSSKSPFLDLIRASKIPIKRHVKIRGDASPYDPAYREYFVKRALCQKITLRETGSGDWP
jgi:RNA-directed DNA polymerase